MTRNTLVISTQTCATNRSMSRRYHNYPRYNHGIVSYKVGAITSRRTRHVTSHRTHASAQLPGQYVVRQ